MTMRGDHFVVCALAEHVLLLIAPAKVRVVWEATTAWTM